MQPARWGIEVLWDRTRGALPVGAALLGLALALGGCGGGGGGSATAKVGDCIDAHKGVVSCNSSSADQKLASDQNAQNAIACVAIGDHPQTRVKVGKGTFCAEAAGSGSSTSTTGTSTSGTSTTATSTSGTASSATGDLPATIVDVAGSTITRGVFLHWMEIAARSAAGQSPNTPVILPSDPPEFTNCIAQARQVDKKLAHATTQQLHDDCEELFRSLSRQVLDYLIHADWYLADGARLHLIPSESQLIHAFNTARKKTFRTTAAFLAYIRKTGQTPADSLFRVKVGLIATRLKERLHGDVESHLRQSYLRQTHCTALVQVADCGPEPLPG